MDRLVFMSARNLGDAVFHAAFLRALVEAGFAGRYLVWTFPAAAFLFDDMAGLEVVTSSFPMGATGRDFVRGGWFRTLGALLQIRSFRPTATLELVADVRERLMCRFLGASRNLSPEWPQSHRFRRHNRISPSRPSELAVPEKAGSVYSAYGHLLRLLIGRSTAAFSGTVARAAPADARSIGVHPSASAAFKLWPVALWQDLMVKLAAELPGCRFVLFGTAADRPVLDALASAAGEGNHESVVGSLPAFRDRLARCCMLIGLDSFSVHLAHSLGVPSVILVGANDPQLFAPPSAAPVYHQSRCAHQPCGGKPRCVGTSFEYTCMKSIDPDSVRDACRPIVLHTTSARAS